MMRELIRTDKKWSRAAVPACIALFVFAVFSRSLSGKFLNWDDEYNFLSNAGYRGLAWANLKWMFTTLHMGPYQPLTWMSFGLDYLLWGMDPFGYHLTSVVLHGVNAAVFYLICRNLLGPAVRPGPAEENEKDILLSAGFAALLFAVHPLRVESVAWVTERRDVLSGLFYLLAVLSYILTRRADGKNVSFGRGHLFPLAAFALALLSKGSAVSLPAVLILLDVYPLKRLPADPKLWFSRENRHVWLEKVPFFALAAVFGAVGVAGQSLMEARLSDTPGFGWGVMRSAPFYIWKTLVPLDLSPLYGLYTPGAPGFDRPLLLSVLAIAALTAGAIALRRRWPAVPAVWLYYLITLSPTLVIIKFGHQPVADRYSYLSCLGFALLGGAALLRCRQGTRGRARRFCSLLAGTLICVSAALAWRQQRFWLDAVSLWEHALSVAPDARQAHNNLGVVLAGLGRTEEAVEHYREALRIRPDYPNARHNLGLALAALGRKEEAVAQYREALRLKPYFTEALNGLGLALSALGRTEEAAAQHREA
ncbi:MAG TPA: tetratricopeptide repeat protein, partial [Elusimicrobiales bacterium]|nr:tetratricopeptide repeat protein [Elusimicrobiales bacterium]